MKPFLVARIRDGDCEKGSRGVEAVLNDAWRKWSCKDTFILVGSPGDKTLGVSTDHRIEGLGPSEFQQITQTRSMETLDA